MTTRFFGVPDFVHAQPMGLGVVMSSPSAEPERRIHCGPYSIGGNSQDFTCSVGTFNSASNYSQYAERTGHPVDLATKTRSRVPEVKRTASPAASCCPSCPRHPGPVPRGGAPRTSSTLEAKTSYGEILSTQVYHNLGTGGVSLDLVGL